MRKEKSFQNLIIFSFIIFNLYYGYRYLFRYNSSMTSPSYSDTPMAFQMAKYVIALAIILAIFFLLFTNNVKIKLGATEGVILAGTVFCFIKALQFHDVDFFIRNFIFLFCAYAITFVNDDKFENRLIRVNKYLFWYHVVYSAVQLAAYALVGRLPALGYQGGLVRFGGGWDDPNAFAVYLLLPVCYSLSRFIFEKSKKKQAKYMLVFLISVMLELLTFSFTGYLLCVIAAVFMLVRYFRNIRLILVAATFLVVALLGVVFLQDKIEHLFAAKGGSLAIHFEAMKLHFPDSVSDFFFGGSQYVFYENNYNTMLTNYGVIYFALSLCLKVYFIYTAYKVQKANRSNPLYFVGFLFICCMIIGQAALPFSLIFPINYIYWSFAFFFLKKYREMRVQRAFVRRRSLRRAVETN